MDKKVFVTHQLPGDRIHDLGQLCDMNIWMGPGLLPAAALGEELSESHGLLCLLTDRIDRNLLDGLPNLEFVSSMSVGVDHIDVDALTERGIPHPHTSHQREDTQSTSWRPGRSDCKAIP